MGKDHKLELPNRLAGDGGYKGKTLLITGATGFLGRLLMEKILRTCPLVERIYIIARSKKGKDPQTRLKELFADPVFDLMKKTSGEEIINKVTVIAGDMAEIGLGISPENRKTLATEVEIIFHSAATVRFDEPFKRAILINVRGTKSLLDLAKECKKLLVFAHVSTAYSQPQEKVLYEKTYPPPANPEEIIKLVEMLDEKIIDTMAPAIKGKSPNTYTFTKALGEGLVNNEMNNLPVIILRPSIVVPVWKDPIPGWTNNTGGPIGLMIAGGKGVLRTVYCKSDALANFIPVDLVVNTIILAAYDFINVKKRRIFNIISTSSFTMSWNTNAELARRVSLSRIPLNWVVWYPDWSLTSSKWQHNLYVVLFHYIPAIILDFLITLTGNKPVLWNIQQRITKGSELFEFYTNNEWEFSNANCIEARKTLNKNEREIYKLDEEGADLDEYFYNCIHAARLYLLKEGDETIPRAKRHLKIMWAVDRICKLLMQIGFLYLLMKHFIFPIIGMEF